MWGGEGGTPGGGAEWNVGGRLVKYLADNRFHRYSGMQQGSLPANSGPLGRVFSILLFFEQIFGFGFDTGLDPDFSVITKLLLQNNPEQSTVHVGFFFYKFLFNAKLENF